MIDVSDAINVPLLLSIPSWLVVGAAIGRVAHAIPIRRPDANPRPDIVVATVLGGVGAVIGGAVAWSMSGAADPVLTSFVGAALGALFLCVLFQFVVPV